MAYNIERTALLADQLERLAHLNVYQLAGQVANLEFWLDEVDHDLRVIDDYQQRFRRLRDAQMAWVKAHGTRVSGYCPHCEGLCELGPQSPDPPTRVPSEQMGAARSKVQMSAYRLLLRCHRAGLLDETALRAACERFGVHAEPEDLERAQRNRAGGSPMAAESAMNGRTKRARSGDSRKRRS